jgi:uncharacterized membrane protein YfcA
MVDNMDLLYTLSGLAVGFVVGLTGVGGGSLMTPLLVLFFGVAPSVAVGTDLLYAALTKAGGVWVHGKNSTVDWRVARLLATGSLPAALVTLSILHATGTSKVVDGVLLTSLGIALILTALALIFKSRLQALAPDWTPRQQTVLTIIAGALLGVLVSLSSVGAGALGAAFLVVLYPRFKAVQIVGTDLAHAVPLTLVAGLGHALLGHVNWALLVSLLLGSLPGIWLGSKLAVAVPERLLRTTLAGMLVLIGGRLVF